MFPCALQTDYTWITAVLSPTMNSTDIKSESHFQYFVFSSLVEALHGRSPSPFRTTSHQRQLKLLAAFKTYTSRSCDQASNVACHRLRKSGLPTCLTVRTVQSRRTAERSSTDFESLIIILDKPYDRDVRGCPTNKGRLPRSPGFTREAGD